MWGNSKAHTGIEKTEKGLQPRIEMSNTDGYFKTTKPNKQTKHTKKPQHHKEKKKKKHQQKKKKKRKKKKRRTKHPKKKKKKKRRRGNSLMPEAIKIQKIQGTKAKQEELVLLIHNKRRGSLRLTFAGHHSWLETNGGGMSMRSDRGGEKAGRMGPTS